MSLALSLLGLLLCHVYTTPETIDTGDWKTLAETEENDHLYKNVKVEDVEDVENVEVGVPWRVNDIGLLDYAPANVAVGAILSLWAQVSEWLLLAPRRGPGISVSFRKEPGLSLKSSHPCNNHIQTEKDYQTNSNRGMLVVLSPCLELLGVVDWSFFRTAGPKGMHCLAECLRLMGAASGQECRKRHLHLR